MHPKIFRCSLQPTCSLSKCPLSIFRSELTANFAKRNTGKIFIKKICNVHDNFCRKVTFAIINIIWKITYSSSYFHSSRTDNLCAADLAKYTCAGRQERRQTRILLELISDLISGLALISDLTMETYQPPLQQECDPGRGCMELHIAEYKFGPRNKL